MRVLSPLVRHSRLGIALGIVACVALLVQYLVTSVGFVRDTPGGLDHFVLRPDFIVSVTGAEMLLHVDGTRLYDEAAQRRAEEGALRTAGVPVDPDRLLGFNHPPFAAMAVAGFRLIGLPYSAIYLLWTVLRLAAIAWGLWALSRAWPIRGLSGVLCALLCLAFYPVIASLQVGQTTAFVLLGWAAGSAALRRGNEWAAGAWLALAILKPQYLPLVLLVLVVMRRWRALAAFAAVAGAATILAMPFAGWDWPIRYATLLLKQATDPPNMIIDPAMMQNWRGFFLRVLDFSPSAQVYATAASAVTVLAVIAVWVFAARRQARLFARAAAIEHHPIASSLFNSRLWAFTLCAALLASYHLLYPDLALAVVPAWIILAIALARSVREPTRWAWLGWLWVGWVLGFVVNYQSFQVALAPIWMAITAIWLVVGEWQVRSKEQTS